MHTKRLFAYIIDLIFITSFLMVLFYFLPVSAESKKIQTEMDHIGEKYATLEMSKMDYFMELSSLEKKLDKEEAFKIVIDSVVIVIYYILVPFFMGGSTFGKKIMNLKMVGKENKKINLMALTIRALMVNGLGASILIILGIFVIPANFYLSFQTILIILQLLTLTVSYFMIKYKGNSLGLEDVCSHSKVIKIN